MPKQSSIQMFSLSTMRAARVVLALPLFLLSSPMFGQQTYVGRYTTYVGYAYLDSPMISLTENGVHVQAAVRLKSWLSSGFDFSGFSGSGALTPGVLTTSLQQTLGAQLGQLAAAGQLPSGYTLSVPINSTTQTYEAGPELVYRGFSAMSLLFARLSAHYTRLRRLAQGPDRDGHRRATHAFRKEKRLAVFLWLRRRSQHQRDAQYDDQYTGGLGARPPVQRHIAERTLVGSAFRRPRLPMGPEYDEVT